MDAPDREAALYVTYRSPISQRVFTAFKTGFVSLVMMLLLAGFFWGALVPGVFQSHAPVWVHAVGAVLLLAVAGLVVWLAHRGEPARLVLYEDHLRLGGRVFGVDILFDDVRLVKLERPEHTVGKAQQLAIQQAGGKSMKIWLKAADAAECFNAMRMLCEHIPALGLDDKIYEPVNATNMFHTRWVLAREFRRKARRALLSAVLCTVIGAGAAWGLIAGGAGARNRPRAWMALVILPAGAIGSAVAFSRYRRQVRELDRENAECLAAAKAKAKDN